MDALAALVPAEVLTLHGLILPVTTSTADGKTSISDAFTLSCAFYGLIVVSIVLYVVPRLSKWDPLDYLRASIPPISFVAWTMLQRSTAFDAVAPQLPMSARTVIALFAAVLVGFLATRLADSADKKSLGG